MALEQDLRRLASEQTHGTGPTLTEDETERARRIYRSATNNTQQAAGWQDLLDYVDLSTLLDIIARREGEIAQFLGQDVVVVRRLLELARPLIHVRNRVCHARPLEPDDLACTYDTLVAIRSIQMNYAFQNVSEVDKTLSSNNMYPLTLSIPSYWKPDDDAIPNNLPSPDFDDTGFIGRSSDRESLSTLLLGSHPLINVTGEGGVGKTALTLRCLYDLLDRHPPYDMILWTSLKTTRLTSSGVRHIAGAMTSELELLQGIATALGENLESKPIVDLFILVHDILSTLRILLVIDNLETIDIDTIRPLFLDIPRQSKIVLTSKVGIGELEQRFNLRSMETKDAIALYRRISHVYSVPELHRRPDSIIQKDCEKLFYNPLAIKWFIQSYTNGRVSRALTDPKKDLGEVLEFCFLNLYNALTNRQRRYLRIFVAMSRPLGEVQLCLLSEEDEIEAVRIDVRYLFHSNLIRRTRDESAEFDTDLWTTTEFARRFILSRDSEVAVERPRLQQTYRALMGARDEARNRAAGNPFQRGAILFRSIDEAMVVRHLDRALSDLHDRDFRSALQALEIAKRLCPGFYEVWRISAQVRAASGDSIGAEEDYERALDHADGKSEPLIVFYAQFLSEQDEFERAVEVLATTANKKAAQPQTVACYGRMLALAGRILEGIAAFSRAKTRILELGGDQRAYLLTQYADCLRRAAEFQRDRHLPLDAFDLICQSLDTVCEAISVTVPDQKVINTARKCVRTAFAVLGIQSTLSDWQAIGSRILRLSEKFDLGPECYNSLRWLGNCNPIIANDPILLQIAAKSNESPVTYGRVAMKHPDRDFVFVIGDNGQKYFAHRNELMDRSRWLEILNGDHVRVRFQPGRARDDGKPTPAHLVEIV